MGFRLNLKCGGIYVKSLLSTSSSSWPRPYSCRGRDSSYILARSSVASIFYGNIKNGCTSPPQITENYYLKTAEVKDNILMFDKEDLSILEATQASQFQLLMNNLDLLASMFVDSNAIGLENNILKQLERLGALRLFNSCLSRTNKTSTNSVTNTPVKPNAMDEIHAIKVIIHSGKKEVRKLKRKKSLEMSSHNTSCDSQETKLLFVKRSSKSLNKQQKFSTNEADLASGVKFLADLEKIRTMLKENSGQVASLASWAEAAGIEKKKLQQHLHFGWQCQFELMRSTRSLVLFISRNYWGCGVAFEDLIQAGNMGVLQGAERFDQSRGYKFSTYIQYWIRKSMSTLVARHARGIRIPSTLSKAINQVQKARKALSTRHGKYADDFEIAKYTGLSITKITNASKCLRVVGSLDQTIGDFVNLKYSEVQPYSSMMSSEEFVRRQQMIKDIYTFLNNLDQREKQVLIQRFGLGNCQRKSLEEIGRLLCVSKEWIRKIERTALTKLSEDSLEIMSQYVYTQ